MYIASNQQGIERVHSEFSFHTVEIERSPALEFCRINDLGGSNKQLLVNCATLLSGGSRISQGSQPQRGVNQSIIWQNFCGKLHENERKWTDTIGGRP